jgi:hypothetical protein
MKIAGPVYYDQEQEPPPPNLLWLLFDTLMANLMSWFYKLNVGLHKHFDKALNILFGLSFTNKQTLHVANLIRLQIHSSCKNYLEAWQWDHDAQVYKITPTHRWQFACYHE